MDNTNMWIKRKVIIDGKKYCPYIYSNGSFKTINGHIYHIITSDQDNINTSIAGIAIAGKAIVGMK